MADSAFLATLTMVPLELPPPGQVSNFVNPESTGYLVTVFGSIFLVPMIIFFTIRIYSKTVIAGKFGWDDLTCTIGFILTILQYLVSITSAYTGRHTWDVSVAQIATSNFFLLDLLQSAVCPLALGFIKLTFFLFFWQIFYALTWARIAIILGAVISSTFYILCFALAIFFGVPRSGESWLLHGDGGLQKKQIQLSVPQAVISVFFDFYIIILPIAAIWNLQMNFKRKLGIVLIFLTGAMACVCSILALYFRIELQSTKDILRLVIQTLITSLVELQIGIVCSCMPAFALLSRLRKRNDSRKSANVSWSRHLSSLGGRFSSHRSRASRPQERYKNMGENKQVKEYSMEEFNLAIGKMGSQSYVQAHLGRESPMLDDLHRDDETQLVHEFRQQVDVA